MEIHQVVIALALSLLKILSHLSANAKTAVRKLKSFPMSSTVNIPVKNATSQLILNSVPMMPVHPIRPTGKQQHLNLF
jgi:hypothetical protein